MAEITVLGAGGWGLALALSANRLGHVVNVWSCFEDEINTIRRDEEHKKLLPGVFIPKNINLTTDLSVTSKSDLVIIAVPSFAVEQTAKNLAQFVKPTTIITNVAKGFSSETKETLGEVIKRVLPSNPVTVLSGPTHAEEVSRALPCSIVSASDDIDAAKAVQDMMMSNTFRVYVNNDMKGVELCGSFKNVMALAAGISDGMKLGDNCKAALMTRGLHEMARIGEAFGADKDTYSGLAGIGDLIVTCGSMHSRRAGILIGEGVPAEQAVKQVGTVEGYFAAKTAYELAKEKGVEMPITEQCYKICYEDADPRTAIGALMSRERKSEV